jgi:hypothetical protein
MYYDTGQGQGFLPGHPQLMHHSIENSIWSNERGGRQILRKPKGEPTGRSLGLWSGQRQIIAYCEA